MLIDSSVTWFRFEYLHFFLFSWRTLFLHCFQTTFSFVSFSLCSLCAFDFVVCKFPQFFSVSIQSNLQASGTNSVFFFSLRLFSFCRFVKLSNFFLPFFFRRSFVFTKHRGKICMRKSCHAVCRSLYCLAYWFFICQFNSICTYLVQNKPRAKKKIARSKNNGKMKWKVSERKQKDEEETKLKHFCHFLRLLWQNVDLFTFVEFLNRFGISWIMCVRRVVQSKYENVERTWNAIIRPPKIIFLLEQNKKAANGNAID